MRNFRGDPIPKIQTAGISTTYKNESVAACLHGPQE